ncbi:MAG: hypothetical protein QM607_04245 [Microbacterium sp.]
MREPFGETKRGRDELNLAPATGEGGVRLGVDLNDNAALLDLMESDEDGNPEALT